MNSGFSTKSTRLLAYEFALKNNKICPYHRSKTKFQALIGSKIL